VVSCDFNKKLSYVVMLFSSSAYSSHKQKHHLERAWTTTNKAWETLHKARLTALHAICLQIFRHIA
jgi:hypothetical protein